MYKSILVPVDLDHPEVAVASLRTAGALVDDDGIVTVVHVVDEIPGYATTYLPEGALEQRRNEAHATLNGFASTAGVDAKAVVLTSGRASTAILEAAEDIGNDCIIVASHQPGLQDYFLGSTAARIVRHATCSVLVTR